MRQALELAIEWIEKQPEEITASKYDVNSRYVVLRELEAALAQPEQEPVAIEYWLQDTMESGRWVKSEKMARATAERMLSGEFGAVFSQGRIVEPTFPPQPKEPEQEPVAFIDEQGTLRYYKPSDFNQCEYGGLVRLYKEKT